MLLSVVNLQEAYAKALLVDRSALAERQLAGDVLGGHELLLEAFNSDVRPLCARARAATRRVGEPVGGVPKRRATQNAGRPSAHLEQPL